MLMDRDGFNEEG